MRRIASFLVLGLCLVALASLGLAQGTRDKVDPKSGVDAYVARLMAFDKNGDGKLTREELTDERYLRLFERADANKDGVVTKEELLALATQEVAAQPGGQDKGDKGGKGGKDGFQKDMGGFQKDAFGKDKGGFGKDKGGFGKDKGGFGPRPQPGQIMPDFVAEMLKLTDDQKTKMEALQKDVDGRLEKILTDDQKKQLKQMKEGGGRPPFGPPPGDKQ
jgi:hypothetical protein